MIRGVLLSALLLLSPASFAAPDTSDDGLLRDHLWQELTSLPKGKRPTVGVVLSAGSMRATAHLGVLSNLEHVNFPVDVVAGTSMGAVIGSLYAGGTPVKKMFEMSTKLRLEQGSNISASNLLSLVLFDSLLSSEKTEKFLRETIQAKRFEDMPKPFACVAMDLYSGEAIIFREGPLAPAVRASMSLPGIFTPVEYRHRFLVDGGVVGYIPVDAARLLGAEWVIASVTETDYTRTRPRNVLETLEQVIDIRGAYISRDQRRKVDYLIEPDVGDIGMYEPERMQEAVSKGVIAGAHRIRGAMDKLTLYSLPKMSANWKGGGR
jgi:NTE family protein